MTKKDLQKIIKDSLSNGKMPEPRIIKEGTYTDRNFIFDYFFKIIQKLILKTR